MTIVALQTSHHNTYYFLKISNLIPTWRLCERTKWERYQCFVMRDLEILCGNSSWKHIQLLLRCVCSGFRVPAGAGNFSLHHLVQTGSGTYPVSYPMCARVSFPGDKAAGAWSWPLISIHCRGERMRGAIPPLSQVSVCVWNKFEWMLLHLHKYGDNENCWGYIWHSACVIYVEGRVAEWFIINMRNLFSFLCRFKHLKET